MTAKGTYIKKLNIGIILFLIFVLPPMVYFYTTRGYNTFSKLEIVGVDGHKIPEFSFVNQNNEIIVNDTMKGNIYIANFFFSSCPTICPVATKNMAYIQDKLDVFPNIRFLTHTVDPQNDTPEKMLHYVEKLRSKNVKIDLSNWDFVTGDKEDLYNIAEAYLVTPGFQDENSPGGYVHSPNFIIVDKEGRIRTGIDRNGEYVGAYDGTNDAQVKDLISDVKVLLAEYKRPVKNED